MTGEAYSSAGVAARQLAVAKAVADAGTVGGAGSALAAHPYLGYIYDPTKGGTAVLGGERERAGSRLH